jgi:hypothetical protein
MKKEAIKNALALIFQGIERLRTEFPEKEFTIDGRLVGDIGEVIAALEYDIKLSDILVAGHDGVTTDGRRVQIKATFKDSLTFRTVPDYYLGFKLYKDGRHEEIYNGPGKYIYDRYKDRRGIGINLLSFPNKELYKMSKEIADNERIIKRKG